MCLMARPRCSISITATTSPTTSPPSTIPAAGRAGRVSSTTRCIGELEAGANQIGTASECRSRWFPAPATTGQSTFAVAREHLRPPKPLNRKYRSVEFTSSNPVKTQWAILIGRMLPRPIPDAKKSKKLHEHPQPTPMFRYAIHQVIWTIIIKVITISQIPLRAPCGSE